MSRPVPFGPLALGFLLLAPAPFFALLCRGHAPSRFETANLPVWERRPLPPAPPSAFFRLPPAPPGAVRVPNNPWLAVLLRADENKLSAGAAGEWLESACAWGRAPAALAAKQDRVAIRLLAAQGDDGTFGLDPGRVTLAPWSPAEASEQRSCLRGLLAYYAASGEPAAIQGALMAGEPAAIQGALMAGEPAAIQGALMAGEQGASAARGNPDPAWVYPLVRLAQEADDPRFLEAARRQAALGGPDGDGLGLCALYEATGQPGYLAGAHRAWARNPASPTLTAEMLLLTGRPGYAAALARLPPAGPEMARAAWTRAPLGVAVNTGRDSGAVFRGLRLEQKTAAGVRTITVGTAAPTSARLCVFLPPGQPARILVNGVPLDAPAPPGGYALLARRWRDGDRVEVGYAVSKSPASKLPAVPAQGKPLRG